MKKNEIEIKEKIKERERREMAHREERENSGSNKIDIGPKLAKSRDEMITKKNIGEIGKQRTTETEKSDNAEDAARRLK